MAGFAGIEILIRNCPPDRIVAWLSEVAGPLGDATGAGDATVYTTRLGPVVVRSGVDAPGGTSVWFNAADLPWPSGAALARLAHGALGCSVMCDPGPEFAGVHPLAPVWLEVSDSGERLLVPGSEPRSEADPAPR